MFAPLQACGTTVSDNADELVSDNESVSDNADDLGSDNADESEQKVTPNPQVNSVAIQSDRTLLMLGESLTLPVAVDATGGASSGVDWSSSDETVATVSTSGEVTALATGTVQITATSQEDASKKATYQLQVVGEWSFTLAPDGSIDSNLDPEDLTISTVRAGPQGRVVVAGITTTNFDGDGPATGSPSAPTDGFVVVFDANGSELWRKQIRGAAADVVSAFIRGDRLVLSLDYFKFVSSDPLIFETGSGVVVHDLNTGSEVWSYTEPADGSSVVGAVLQSDDTIVALGQRNGDELWMFQSNDSNSWSDTPKSFDMAGVGTPVRLDLGANDALQTVFENNGTLSLGEIAFDGENATFTKASDLSETDPSELPNPRSNGTTYENELRFANNGAVQMALVISEGNENDTTPFRQKLRVLTGSTTPNVDGQAIDVEFGNSPDQETTIFGIAFNRDDQVVVAGASASTDAYWSGNGGFLRVYTFEGQEVYTQLIGEHVRGLAIDDANRVIVAKQAQDDSSLTIEALSPQIMQPPANQ